MKKDLLLSIFKLWVIIEVGQSIKIIWDLKKIEKIVVAFVKVIIYLIWTVEATVILNQSSAKELKLE